MKGKIEKSRAALEQENPHEAIHDARKEFKKIRALVRLFRDEIGDKKYRKANAFYRELGKKMSDARDVTAMLETLDKLQDELDLQLCGEAFDELKNHLSARKSAVSRVQVKHDLLLEQVKAELDDAEDLMAKWRIKHDGFEAFAPGLSRTYNRCRKAMKKAYKKKTPEAFHEWRKRAKYLRNEVDYLRKLWVKPMKAQEKELHQLTDYLGDDHDLAVLKSYIRELDSEHKDAYTIMISLIEKKQKSLKKMALPQGRKLLHESTDDYIKRMHLYWKQSLKSLQLAKKDTLPAVS
jgi:CHAD domain-containing protein